MGQVCGAVLPARRAYRDKDDLSLRDAFIEVLTKTQLTATQVGLQHGLQPRLVNRRLAMGKPSHTLRIALNADHPIAHFGKTGCRYQPHVSCANHTNPHRLHSSLSYRDCS